MSRSLVIRITATRLAVLLAWLLTAAGAIAARAEPVLHSLQTDHYTIHTDLQRPLAEDLGRRMDEMYAEYSRRLADFKSDSDLPRMEVYLFAKQEDYLGFTGERLKNTGGVYIPRRNLLAAFLEGQGRDGLRRTLQHEAFHQFAYNAISQKMPVWLNEGLAQLFEEGIWTGDRFWLGQAPPRRIRQLQADLKYNRIINFDQFMKLTPEQWSGNLNGAHDLGATQYNQSWAMVYFLAHARDAEGKDKYRGRLLELLRLLHEGKDGDAAFQQAFSNNVAGFQQRFIEFAERLQPTAEATLIDRQSVLGDLMAELLRRGKKFSSIAHFRRAALSGGYRMHYSKGELQWDSDPDLRIYFADLDGKRFAADDLYLETHTGTPLPDIICRCSPRFQLRTRFYPTGDHYEHEVLVEAPSNRRAGAE